MRISAKMASSLENKIEEIRARLKAENDSEKRDIMPRELSIGSPNPRKPKPCEYLPFIVDFGDYNQSDLR
jgi:hypothetical protein